MNIEVEREYLPIFWTNYYIKNNFGNLLDGELQKCIDSLDRNKKYFTIIQYDDNILEDLRDLDILIFSQGGFGKYKERSYVIPLNCQMSNNQTVENKDIFTSFVGSINGRHHIREKIKIVLDPQKYKISESTGYDNFIDTMSRSVFSLCPRGYGQTSFRIHESLNFGSIPVYIYDDPLLPFNDLFDFSDIGIAIHIEEIENLDRILESIDNEEMSRLRENGKLIYKNFFEYEGCFDRILNKLKNK